MSKIEQHNIGNPEERQDRSLSYQEAKSQWEVENPDKVALMQKFSELVGPFYTVFKHKLDSVIPATTSPEGDTSIVDTPQVIELYNLTKKLSAFYNVTWEQINKRVKKTRAYPELENNPIGGLLSEYEAIAPAADEIEDAYQTMLLIMDKLSEKYSEQENRFLEE